MSKITQTKYLRKFETLGGGKVVKRDNILPAQPREKQRCGTCNKIFMIAPGQIVKCKHK